MCGPPNWYMAAYWLCFRGCTCVTANGRVGLFSICQLCLWLSLVAGSTVCGVMLSCPLMVMGSSRDWAIAAGASKFRIAISGKIVAIAIISFKLKALFVSVTMNCKTEWRVIWVGVFMFITYMVKQDCKFEGKVGKIK